MAADKMKAMGTAAFKEGRFEAAVQHFTAAIELNSQSHVLFSNRSGALAALGRYEEALDDAERVIALSHMWPKGYSRRGAALYGLGRYQEALHAFEAGLAIEPSSAQMAQAANDVRGKLASSGHLLNAAGTGSVVEVQACLQAGIHPDGVLDADGSSALLIAARQGHGEVVSELLCRGADVKLANRNGETAFTQATRASHQQVLVALGAALSSDCTTSPSSASLPPDMEAVESVQASALPEGSSSPPSRPKVSFLSGLAEKSRLAADRARSAAEGAVQTMKQKAEDLKREREQAEMARRDSEPARKDGAERALRADSGDNDRDVSIAVAAAAGRPATAETTETMTGGAALAEACRVAGNEAFKAGHFQEAVRHYSEALEHEPSSLVFLSNRSGALAALGRYEEALDDAERVIALSHMWPKGYSRRGAALYGLGRYQEALHAFEAGLAIEPSSAQMAQAANDVRGKLASSGHLLNAAGTGSVVEVQACLQAGIHPDGVLDADGSSALLIAARQGHGEVVSELLCRGADVKLANRNGETAFTQATRASHQQVLVALGAALSSDCTTSPSSASLPPDMEAVESVQASALPEGSSSPPSRPKVSFLSGLAEKSRLAADRARSAAEGAVQTMKQKAEDLKREREQAEMARRDSEPARKDGAERALRADSGDNDRDVSIAVAAAAGRPATAETTETMTGGAALAEACRVAGNEAFKAGHFQEAVRHYSEALTNAPASVVLYSNRSGALSAAGFYKNALADADRCISLEPSWAKGHARKAAALHGLQKYKAAIESYEEALELEPKSDALLLGREHAMFALNQSDYGDIDAMPP